MQQDCQKKTQKQNKEERPQAQARGGHHQLLFDIYEPRWLIIRHTKRNETQKYIYIYLTDES